MGICKTDGGFGFEVTRVASFGAGLSRPAGQLIGLPCVEALALIRSDTGLPIRSVLGFGPEGSFLAFSAGMEGDSF